MYTCMDIYIYLYEVYICKYIHTYNIHVNIDICFRVCAFGGVHLIMDSHTQGDFHEQCSRAPGWMFDRRDETKPNYMGINMGIIKLPI